MAIDFDARKAALDILTKLDMGSIKLQELENEWPRSQDPALNGIKRWLWTLYNDEDDVLTVRQLSDCDQRILANCKFFLASNYAFPMKELTAISKAKEKLRWGVEWNVECTLPDYDSWPFPREIKDN